MWAQQLRVLCIFIYFAGALLICAGGVLGCAGTSCLLLYFLQLRATQAAACLLLILLSHVYIGTTPPFICLLSLLLPLMFIICELCC
jgi:hypothetical protein